MAHKQATWWRQAACRGAPSEMFFPEPGPGSRSAVAAAKAICASCPVRQDCLAEALATREARGVWGGFTPSERRTLRRRRGGDAA